MICLSGKTRGTCIPDCEGFGVCHCDCGQPTRRYGAHSKERYVQGDFCIHANGHRARPFNEGGGWRKRGISAEKVLPMWRFLIAETGSIAAASRRIDIPLPTGRALMRPNRKNVTPDTAERIVAAVLAIRSGRTPDAPHIARVPLSVEREPRTHRRRHGNTETTVSSLPLRAYLDREGYSLNGFGSRLDRNLHRWFSAGRAPVLGVDDFCCHELHVHPIRIYGDEWPDSPGFTETEAIA